MQNYIQEDPMIIDKIVYEVKSQGIFDQFRKECIADVDTKPAYQNLRQRVEGSVSGFLNKQKWSPDMNKNHVREMLRKNIYESGFLETGVERIVDQVVNPKINSIFLPKVSELVYKFFGIQQPNEDKKDTQQPSKSETLLPTDLEAVSPESDKHSEPGNIEDQTLDDSKIDEDESPPFEPLDEQIPLVAPEETSIDSHMSGFSGLISHDSNGQEISKPAVIETSNQESVTSKQSSDRLSIVMSDDNDTKMEIDEPKIDKSKTKEDKEKKNKDDKSKDDKSKDEKNKDEKSHKSRHDSRSDKKDKDRKDSKDSKYRDHDRSKDRKDSSSRNGKSDKDKEREKSKSHSSSSSSHRHSSSSHRSHKDSSSSSKDRDKSKSKLSSSSSSNKESSRDKYKDDKKKDSKRHHSSSSSSDKYKKDNHHSNKSSSSRSKDKKDSKSKDKKECEGDTKKRTDRRSTDRDSNDGHSSLKSSASSFESFSSNVQSSQQEKKSSNNTNSGDSGNSDMVEEVSSAVNLDEELSISAGEIKLFKPKFASNFQEAKRLMKIRKKLAQIEKERNNHKLYEPRSVEKVIENILESPPLPSVNVSAASWDALEAKLNETIAQENCYEDDSSCASIEIRKRCDKDDVYYLEKDESPVTKRYRNFITNLIVQLEKKFCAKIKADLIIANRKRKLVDVHTDIKNNNNKKFCIEVHESFSLPLSPAESDNSIDKKSDSSEATYIIHKVKRTKAPSNTKKRYSSEDLYKPRLSFSSSRRRLNRNAGID